MKWPKLRELKEAVKSVVKGPYTHAFPAAPAFVPDNLRGKPVFDEEHCIGCGACAEVCPARAIEVKDGPGPNGTRLRRLTLHYGNCIFCGDCVRCCTTGKGISLSREFELSGLNRTPMVETVEKELVTCEICGGDIAPRDHLLWIGRRLGAQVCSNTTLLLVAHEELGLRETVPRDDRPLNRADIQRVLCTACRRAVTLLDEWGPI